MRKLRGHGATLLTFIRKLENLGNISLSTDRNFHVTFLTIIAKSRKKNVKNQLPKIIGELIINSEYLYR